MPDCFGACRKPQRVMRDERSRIGRSLPHPIDRSRPDRLLDLVATAMKSSAIPVDDREYRSVVHFAPAVIVFARREQQRLASRMRREIVGGPVRQQIRGQPRVIGLGHEQQRIARDGE